MSVHRYAAKRDLNEPEIIEALRAAGATVVQLSVLDLLVGFNGLNFLIEVKGEKGKLTDAQYEFFESWNGQCDVARTIAEALAIIGVDLDE